MLFETEYVTEVELKNAGMHSVGTNVRIARNCCIVGLKNISIGNNVRIDSCCIVIAMGDKKLSIASHVHIGGQSYINATYGVCIGDFANISQGCRIYSGSDDFSGHFLTNPTVSSELTNITKGDVVLERHVIVGSGTVILPNVTIGEGTAVGAVSLVKASLEPWGIYCGIPVRHIAIRSRRLLDLEVEGVQSGRLHHNLGS